MISKDELKNLDEFYYILRRNYFDNSGFHIKFYVFQYDLKKNVGKKFNPAMMFKTKEEAEYNCFEMNSLYGYI